MCAAGRVWLLVQVAAAPLELMVASLQMEAGARVAAEQLAGHQTSITAAAHSALTVSP